MNKDTKGGIGKNILTGVLFLGGLAAGFVGGNMVAGATQKVQPKINGNDLCIQNGREIINLDMQEVNDINTVVDLVRTGGTQVILDDETGRMFVAFINEDDDVEISDITEDELNELIETINAISTGELMLEEFLDSME